MHDIHLAVLNGPHQCEKTEPLLHQQLSLLHLVLQSNWELGMQRINDDDHLSVVLPDSMAAIVNISLEQLYSGLAMIILDSCGSNGNSDIREPTSVKFPSSSRAPK
jgi:hypothetical protein